LVERIGPTAAQHHIEEGHTAMTTKRSEPSPTDRITAQAGAAGGSQDDSDTTAGQTSTQEDAGVSEAPPEGTRHVTDIAAKMKRAVPVRRASANAAAQTRNLARKTAAWARRNPKAVAGAIAGTAALGSAAWRRIRRGERRR
jgi:hypothetical protein